MAGPDSAHGPGLSMPDLNLGFHVVQSSTELLFLFMQQQF
jgi:hypothetical protein